MSLLMFKHEKYPFYIFPLDREDGVNLQTRIAGILPLLSGALDRLCDPSTSFYKLDRTECVLAVSGEMPLGAALIQATGQLSAALIPEKVMYGRISKDALERLLLELNAKELCTILRKQVRSILVIAEGALSTFDATDEVRLSRASDKGPAEGEAQKLLS